MAGFYDILEELKQRGEVFSPQNLHRLSYEELHLACIGNAGVCRCSVDDVINEKQARRALLLGLPPEKTSRMPLSFQLREDLELDRVLLFRSVPSWHDLSPLIKLLFKLTCLENHPHDAQTRLVEVVDLSKDEALPTHIARVIRMEFRSVLLSKPSEEWIRTACHKAIALINPRLTDAELQIVDRMELRDYVCSAGCFGPLGD